MEFKKVKLKDIVTVLGDGIHGTPKYSENGEYYFINGNNLRNGKIIIKQDTKRVDFEEYEKYKKDLNNRTLLVSINGTLGNIAVYNNEKCILGKSACYFNIKENVNKQFIKYILYSNEFQKYIQEYATGTTIKNMSLKAMREYEFKLPELDIQNKIEHILLNIDKKIELNNQINDNLYKIIKNNFKYKFIENINANKIKMSELVDKTIEGDWGKEEETENYNSEVLCIRGADIPEMDKGNKGKVPNRFILEKNLKQKKLTGKEVVIEISGGSPTQSTGRCVYITDELEKSFDKTLICTNFCRAIKLKNDNYLPIFYLNLKYLYEKNIMFLYENGTTGIKNLDLTSLLENEDINIIEENKILEFNNLFYRINNKIIKNAEENRTLEQLLDTLLPKLMNGEIDLENIEV